MRTSVRCPASPTCWCSRTAHPPDPGAYVVNEPPGAFNVGEVIFLGPDKFIRILKMDGPPEGDVPEAREWHGVWTVEPA